MLVEIVGRCETPGEKGVKDRRVLDIVNGGSGWVLRLSEYRGDDGERYLVSTILLESDELTELCRWWSEVKGAVAG
jgi:hypothetical protein